MDNVQVMLTPEELNLVRRFSRRVYAEYCPAGRAGQVTLEDLSHYGIIGLLEAKRKFNPERGVPWLKFAAFRVRGAMIDHLRKEPMVRLPQEKQQRVKELAAARTRLESAGMVINAQTLADELGWTEDTVHSVETLSSKTVPLAGEKADRGDYDRIGGALLPDNSNDPESAHLREELFQVVQACLERISPKERLVFVAKILENQKLREIAGTFACSLQTAKNWLDKALIQIRSCLEEHGYSI